MDEFENFLFTEFSKALVNLHHSPYAIGLVMLCEEDDLRRPSVRMITNTYENAKARSGEADSELEALWNSSYWLWKTEAAVGIEYLSFEGDYLNIEGITLRENWIRSLGLWYEDEFRESNFEMALEIGGKINVNFDEVCLKLAKKLHLVIVQNLKVDLPIIFFNREGEDHETLGLTFLANPSHLLIEYARYIRKYLGNEWGDFMEKNVNKDLLTYSSLYE